MLFPDIMIRLPISNLLRFLLVMTFFLFFLSEGASQSSELPEAGQSHFHGFYLGASLGSQNVFGGAFIDDLDVLAQKSDLVLDLSIGYRHQFLQNRLILGGEFLYGFTGTKLQTKDPRYLFPIHYANKFQLGLGIQLGLVIGAEQKSLIYLFGQEARRRFDIDFSTSDGTQHVQEDTQNFTTLGLGFEYSINDRFNIRANIAKIFVDYGELETTIDVDDKMDFNIGVLFNLRK